MNATGATVPGTRDRLLWTALGVAAVANIAWLVIDRRAPRLATADAVAYGECRGAVRRGQERSDLRFPTMDLIRVSHDGQSRATIRGFFETPGATRPTWYSCDASRDGPRWKVDRVMVDR